METPSYSPGLFVPPALVSIDYVVQSTRMYVYGYTVLRDSNNTYAPIPYAQR